MPQASMSEPKRHWYVAQTKPRQERLALDNLTRQGYSAYCPRAALLKHRRKRWQAIDEPLFPRYLFIELAEGVDDFAPIRSTLGVTDMVRFGGRPAIIQQGVIAAIQEQEQKLCSHVGDQPQWEAGDAVVIIDGPFAGLKAIFQKTRGADRVLVLFELLGSQNRAIIDANDVAPAVETYPLSLKRQYS